MPLFPSAHATHDRPQVISGIILDTVTDNVTPVRVTIPTYGDRCWGPLPWMPRIDDDGRLVRPVAGDPCVVAMTLDRQPLGIVEWGDGAAVGSGPGWADVGVLQVDVGGLLARLADADPVGRVVHLAAGPVPPGWLLCNGQKVTAAYPVLRQWLLDAGSPWGTDGADPRVENLIEKFLRGNTTVGGTGGQATVTLAVSEIPPHDHQPITAGNYPPLFDPASTAGSGWKFKSGNPGEWNLGTGSGLTTTKTGGGAAHENLPPYADHLPIIRAY